jgi:hypothetical protein
MTFSIAYFDPSPVTLLKNPGYRGLEGRSNREIDELLEDSKPT